MLRVSAGQQSPYNAPAAGAGARASIPKKVASDEKVNKYAKYVTACGLVPELELLFYISIKLPHSLASSYPIPTLGVSLY